MKQIDTKVSELLFEWLTNLIDEEEQDKITLENYEELLPKDKHFINRGTFYLSFYTPRWVKQTIKKLYKRGKDIDTITIKDLEWDLMRKNQNRASRIL